MTELAVVDDMIGDNAYAINLIAYPSAQTKEILCALQDRIVDGMPSDRVYKCPENSLHMSVFQFVHSRKSNSPLQVSVWNKHCEEIDIHLQSLLNETQVCALESPSVQVSATAVIVKFASTRSIELLRDQLEVCVKQTDLTWNRPTIHHVTIGRYINPFPLREIASAIREIELPDLTWNIDSLSLVQEDVYPSLENKLVKMYMFGQAQ